MNGPANWPTPKNQTATNVGKANPSRNTKPELRLRSALHALGLRFYKHHRVRDGLLRPPEVDIAFTRLKLVVQVHGAFWHGRLQTPKHNNEYWTAKFAYNRERDKIVARRLKKAGWRLVVVWDNWSLRRQVNAVVRAMERIKHAATQENVQQVAGAIHGDGDPGGGLVKAPGLEGGRGGGGGLRADNVYGFQRLAEGRGQ